MSRHAVLVVKLRGQPLTGGEGLETEAIRVLRELVLGSNGVERGFEVLYEVEATSVGTIQVGGVGGLPAGREDRVNVIADANLRVIEGVSGLQGRVVAGTLDHLAHAIRVDRDRLRPVEEDFDGVTGRLQVGQETEDVLVPTGGLTGGRHDPRGNERTLADGARVLLPVRFTYPVEGGGVRELDEHPEGILCLSFSLA